MPTFANPLIAVLGSYEFLVGFAIGKILLGALFFSPLFRNFAYAGTAASICVLYYRGGLSGILSFADALHGDFTSRPDFTKGAVSGVLVLAGAVGLLRRRNAL